MDAFLVSLMAAVPATIASLAAWRQSSRTRSSIGDEGAAGPLAKQVDRIEDKVNSLTERMGRVEEGLTWAKSRW